MSYCCDFFDFKSDDVDEVRQHVRQNHVDFVANNWIICQLCATFYPKAELKAHKCIFDTGKCALCAKTLNVLGECKKLRSRELFKHMRTEHITIIEVSYEAFCQWNHWNVQYFNYVNTTLYLQST